MEHHGSITKQTVDHHVKTPRWRLPKDIIMDTLESKITAWKDSLLEAGAFSEEQLYELEDHLRQKMDDLLASGKAEEQAFAQATVAIGHPVALGQQFSINNSRLIIKQLVLYFLLGFPVFAAIGQLFDLSKNLSSLFLLELGWRGLPLSIGAFIPWLSIGLLLLWQTIRSPFWLTQIPRKLAAQSGGVLFLILALSFGLTALGHSVYFAWIFDNNQLSPSDYLLHQISTIPTYLSIASHWALIVIGIYLFFSMAMAAIQRNVRPTQLWRKLCLLSMIGGFFMIGSLISFSLRLMGPIGSYAETMQQVQQHVLILMVTLGSTVLFIFRYFHKKGQLFAHS